MNLVAANPSEVDKIVAVRAIGAHDTGIYSTTFRVMASAITPVVGMLLSSQPRLFKYAHTRAVGGLGLIRTLLLLSAGWGLISGLLLCAFRSILPSLFGAPYEATAQLMPWLAISAPLLSLRLCAGSVLVAFGRAKDRLFFEVLGICILVLGILVFAPLYRTHGIAIALALAEASMAGIGWFTISQRIHRADAPSL
jgi:O-antigen/teichoic acid export membrane protein